MESRGLEPNVITLSAAISACEKGGQWQKALELLESMESRGLEPDVIMLSAAIEAVDAASQYQIAMDIMMNARACGFYSKAWSKQNTVDLHDCSAAVSRAIMGCLLQDVRSGMRACQDVMIITGRGKHSAGGKAVLPDEIRSFLVGCDGPTFTEVPKKPGVLMLADQNLRGWLGKKK
jgi:pentatricopeptide repeat protein